VETLLSDHHTGRANREEAIWSLMMLEHWMRAAWDSDHHEPSRATLPLRVCLSTGPA